ncbi:hypothetical protein [Cupriavidus sp. 8B]
MSLFANKQSYFFHIQKNPMPPKRLARMLAALIVAATLAACGGDNNDTSNANPPAPGTPEQPAAREMRCAP